MEELEAILKELDALMQELQKTAGTLPAQALKEQTQHIAELKQLVNEKKAAILAIKALGDLDDAELKQLRENCRSSITGFFGRLDTAILSNLVIDVTSFDNAKALIQAIGVPAPDESLKKKAVDYLVGKGTEYLTEMIPYGDKVVDYLKSLAPDETPQAPNVASLVEQAIKERLLLGTAKQLELTAQLLTYASKWCDNVLENALKTKNQIDRKKAGLKLTIANEFFLQGVINISIASNIKEALLNALLTTINEAKVSITQYCATADMANNPNPALPLETVFGNATDTNLVLPKLKEYGFDVSADAKAISTEKLKQLFPNCTIKFVTKHSSVLLETPKDELPNSYNTNPHVRMAELRDAEYKQKKAEEARIAAEKAAEEKLRYEKFAAEQKQAAEQRNKEIAAKVNNTDTYGGTKSTLKKGVVYDIGMRFGVFNQMETNAEKAGNLSLDYCAARIKEMAKEIAAAKPTEIIYSVAYDQNAAFQPVVLQSTLSQLHDRLRYEIEVLTKNKPNILFKFGSADSYSSKSSARLGYFLEMK